MTKIYLFNNSKGNTDWNACIAMADTGEVLASHICSHIGYMNGDLHDNRPERKEAWKTKFGEYEIVSLPQGQIPPQEVLDKNTELGKEATKNAELASVNITFEDSKEE